MVKLLPILIFTFLLAYLAEKKATQQTVPVGSKELPTNNKVYFIILAIGMALFVGLRLKGNDTFAYRHEFEISASTLSSILKINWSNIASAPGLKFLEIVIKSLGGSVQDYLMITSFFVICVHIWFLRKYTTTIWLSVYFFVVMGCYTFCLAAIKQTIAMSLLLIATDKAIQKKWVLFALFVVLAMLFHAYSFIYLVIPFLFFEPWANKTYILLSATIILSLLLQTFMGSLVSMTETLGYSYSSGEFIGEGVNIFRVAVVWVTILLAYKYREEIKKQNDTIVNLIINASTINALIMFIGLFGTANYFARLANYFLIFQCLALPYLFRFMKSKNKKIVTTAAVVLYFAYFYYENVLANGAFDKNYDFMTIGAYLKQLF